MALICVYTALNPTPTYTTRPRHRASVSHSELVYSSDFTGTHCAYTQRDGQVKLTWWLVTYQNGLPTCRWLPIIELIKQDIEQLLSQAAQ